MYRGEGAVTSGVVSKGSGKSVLYGLYVHVALIVLQRVPDSLIPRFR